ncbi:Efflux ABC transporter, ATP-binding protein [hydrothermal vent metagenome]|uniref:Efflux ABC transporter, ATP-binding protein n=1 Tax=hydrothermal vent metagenome TaxID=652676 RepID=A0A3B1ASY0_9ZZZZ
MAVLLQATHLIKRFGDVVAVNGVSFDLEAGTCFGLLGPNGAGKTTSIEMLEGITHADSGEILYRNKPAGADFRNDAGIMFQSTALQDYMTVREALQMFGSFYPRTTPIDELVDTCSLGEFLDRDSRKLSGGQRQRLLLAIALINNPQVVFLDEPTTGLDPQARHNLWALVKRIRAQGKTILLTTHYMEEAYELCDEIAIMDHGKIITRGSPKTLLAEHFDEVVLQLPRADIPGDPTELPLPVTLREAEETVEILSRDINATIRTLLDNDISLAGLQIRPRTLEDLFLALTGKGLRA